MAVRLISNFRTVVAKVEKSLPTQVMRACHEVRNEWLNVLSGARSGRTYRVPGTRRTYTASAPGEAPAQRLGDLRRSIRVQPRIEPGRVQARVGSDLEYAVYLEYGTRTMQPRPHLRIAYERARPRIEAIFREGPI
ncbi:MAG TPA: HK97-gp10 family putative phage morphogenesis protein [Planctomycetota bacterium]|nr:HK97-gp10 family putative phage morphogenesis protein [Planctomycetota bacterium]